MEEQVKKFVDELRVLSAETGVDGVPRLLALHRRRHAVPEFTPALMTKIAHEGLGAKAEKQVLTFPQSHSGGTVHA